MKVDSTHSRRRGQDFLNVRMIQQFVFCFVYIAEAAVISVVVGEEIIPPADLPGDVEVVVASLRCEVLYIKLDSLTVSHSEASVTGGSHTDQSLLDMPVSVHRAGILSITRPGALTVDRA